MHCIQRIKSSATEGLFSQYKDLIACIHLSQWDHPKNLVVLFARSAAMQTRSFAVVGPTTWNGLPVDLRHLPNGACSQFHHLLKTVLFRLAWVGSASEYLEGALYKF